MQQVFLLLVRKFKFLLEAYQFKRVFVDYFVRRFLVALRT